VRVVIYGWAAGVEFHLTRCEGCEGFFFACECVEKADACLVGAQFLSSNKVY
jgi:hypothetical protein